jgi:murein DD-endopeptidase MepM/ murein hydrolase activator NlpD
MTTTLPSKRSIWISFFALVVLVSGSAGGAVLAQSNSPANEALLPEGPLGEQIGWIIGAANGEEPVTNPTAVISHFSPAYLEETGLPALIEFAYGLIRSWSPVTLESVDVSNNGATGNAMLTAKDGTPLDLLVEIDPASGLISNVQLHALDSGTPGASPEASPEASPVSVVEPPTYDDIAPDYTARSKAITDVGQEALAFFFAGDYQAISDSFSPELRSPDALAALTEAQTTLTTNRVHFEYTEVGAILDGHLSGETIEGYFLQGSLATFTLTADAAQTEAHPTGTWSGKINEPGIEFSVTFSGDAAALAATLSIPSQNIADVPLGAVSFEPEREIGDLLDERALPLGNGEDWFRASYAWGDAYLVFSVLQTADGELTGFSFAPQWPLPADPTAAILPIEPPLDGAWLTFWGGNSEFLNYHVVAPQQRHALDIVIWEDGATYSGDGLEVDDYYAYGQDLYAPVAGEIVAVESSLADMPPALAQTADPRLAEEAAAMAADQGPAGNHVVIETEQGFYVYLAHMKPDSATVAVGDVVVAGDVVGQVGNTGNTSEPHIHIHAQTALDLFDPEAAGVPMTWNNLAVNGEPVENAKPEQGDIIEPVEGSGA